VLGNDRPRLVRTAVLTLAVMAVWRPAVAADALPDFSSDAFLVGRWSCDLEREGRRPAREEAVYSWALGGRWLALTYTMTPGEADLPSVTTTAYETFDAKLGKWVYISASSDGVYGTSYSAGWRGNEKVYGPTPRGLQPWTLAATRVSDTEFTEEVQIRRNEEWHRVFFLRCRKREPAR
jgi:hypothetical protein